MDAYPNSAPSLPPRRSALPGRRLDPNYYAARSVKPGEAVGMAHRPEAVQSLSNVEMGVAAGAAANLLVQRQAAIAQQHGK